MADYVLISGICQWQNGIQISVRHLDEISGVAEDDAMEVFENDYYLVRKLMVLSRSLQKRSRKETLNLLKQEQSFKRKAELLILTVALLFRKRKKWKH